MDQNDEIGNNSNENRSSEFNDTEEDENQTAANSVQRLQVTLTQQSSVNNLSSVSSLFSNPAIYIQLQIPRGVAALYSISIIMTNSLPIYLTRSENNSTVRSSNQRRHNARFSLYRTVNPIPQVYSHFPRYHARYAFYNYPSSSRNSSRATIRLQLTTTSSPRNIIIPGRNNTSTSTNRNVTTSYDTSHIAENYRRYFPASPEQIQQLINEINSRYDYMEFNRRMAQASHFILRPFHNSNNSRNALNLTHAYRSSVNSYFDANLLRPNGTYNTTHNDEHETISPAPSQESTSETSSEDNPETTDHEEEPQND